MSEHFEFNGEKYKKASKHQKEWGEKLISELKLCGNEVILDLGCGDGVLTEQLASLVPKGRVVGIDSSSGMITTAKNLEKSNLRFISMDINYIEFENEFDIIYSNAALHWVKNHSELFDRCFRALKSGGIIKWNFAADGTCSNFISTVKFLMNDDVYKDYFIYFEWPWFMPSKLQYEELVAGSKFKIISFNYENTDRYFADCNEMIKWIDQPSIVPFIKQVPDEKKEEFRNKLIDIMIKKTQCQDGRCFETFRRINISAVKSQD